jgi:hypothetical protein
MRIAGRHVVEQRAAGEEAVLRPGTVWAAAVDDQRRAFRRRRAM